MSLMLLIGIPVFLIFGGALLAFGFHGEAQLIEAARPATALESKPLVSFQPTGWTGTMKEATVEEIVASIEAHLKRKREEAAELVLPLD